jgi:hypothetical protein
MYLSEPRRRSWSSVTMKRMFGFAGRAIGDRGTAQAAPDPKASVASRDRKAGDGGRTEGSLEKAFK